MFLTRLLRANTPSKNSAPSATAGWWQPFLDSGYATLAGETDPASAEAALTYHAWYRAISIIAQKVAAVPKHLLKRTANEDGKERAREHPVYSLVHERVNEEQTAFQFWLQMAGHVPSRGNAYAAIFSVGGVPAELIPMDPDNTEPIRKDGQLWYLVWPFGYEGREPIRLRPSDVLHFRGFGWDGLVGYPVWAKAAEEIGLARGQRKLEAARNKNSGRPSVILSIDSALDDKVKTRILEGWDRMHVGLDNAYKTAILDRGIKATPISMTAEDLGQSEAAQMSLVAISNYTGVPTSKLGASGKSYASQEQEDQAFVSDCLDFYLNVFDDEASAKLLTPAERAAGYEVKGNRESLLRSSRKDKFESLLKATGGKPIMTQNEARAQIDLPAADEEDADKLLTPLNMGQGGMFNEPEDPNEPGPGRPEGAAATRRGARGIIEYTAARLVRRAAAQANRVSDKPAAFLEWLDSFKAKEAAAFAAELAPCERLAAVIAPARALQSSAAACMLDTIHGRYADIANRTAGAVLQSTVAKEGLDLERTMPATISGRMLGEDRP